MGTEHEQQRETCEVSARPVLGIVVASDHDEALDWLLACGLEAGWLQIGTSERGQRYCLSPQAWAHWMPAWDTLDLHSRAAQALPLLTELVLSLLGSPVERVFPSLTELQAHVQGRLHTCSAAQKTTLAFATVSADRPNSHWQYGEESGFVLRPGVDLIEALTLATQPSVSGTLYDFSCYRATEYVLLLGLAQTLKSFNPALLEQLEAVWREKAIASARFHDTFLEEIGSFESPIPPLYYVPGDRVWFRNPDERSADVLGFEGSWVIYMGRGLFTDFWRPQSAYSLTDKCLEIYFWRQAVVSTENEDDTVDESQVWAHMHDLHQGLRQGHARSVALREHILKQMMAYRDPRGVYASGGCIDTTREHLRCLCPHSADIALPHAQTHDCAQHPRTA